MQPVYSQHQPQSAGPRPGYKSAYAASPALAARPAGSAGTGPRPPMSAAGARPQQPQFGAAKTPYQGKGGAGGPRPYGQNAQYAGKAPYSGAAGGPRPPMGQQQQQRPYSAGAPRPAGQQGYTPRPGGTYAPRPGAANSSSFSNTAKAGGKFQTPAGTASASGTKPGQPQSAQTQSQSTLAKPTAVIAADKDVEAQGGTGSAGVGSSTGGGGGDLLTAALEQQKKVVARNNRAAPFTEATLLSQKGLWTLYQEFGRLPLKLQRGVSEAEDINKVMALYDDWAMQLHPNAHPRDTLHKIETMSGKALVKRALQQMRLEIEIPRVRGDKAVARDPTAYLKATEEARRLAEQENAKRKAKRDGTWGPGAARMGDRTDMDKEGDRSDDEDGDFGVGGERKRAKREEDALAMQDEAQLSSDSDSDDSDSDKEDDNKADAANKDKGKGKAGGERDAELLKMQMVSRRDAEGDDDDDDSDDDDDDEDGSESDSNDDKVGSTQQSGNKRGRSTEGVAGGAASGEKRRKTEESSSSDEEEGDDSDD